MFRIDNPTAVPSLPTVPAVGAPGFFSNGNEQTGVKPTRVDDWFLNCIQEEILTVVTRAGLTPNKFDNTQLWQALVALYPRQVLSAASTNYYVNGLAGNDSHDGLTPGTAWKTIQRACDYLIDDVDFNGKQVIVNIAAGTYASFTMSSNPIGCLGPGSLTFNGNTADPTQVVVEPSNSQFSYAVSIMNGAGATVQGMTLQAPPSPPANVHLLHVGAGGSNAAIRNLIFGSCTGNHISVEFSGFCNIIGPYEITGGASVHFYSAVNGYIAAGDLVSQSWPPCPATLVGTPHFTASFALCQANSVLNFNSALTFSGVATGVRFYVHTNSLITVYGRGLSYFPGDAAGSVDAATFGVYQP